MKEGTLLPRSRLQGFDYNGSANAILFHDEWMDPYQPLELVVSYARWASAL